MSMLTGIVVLEKFVPKNITECVPRSQLTSPVLKDECKQVDLLQPNGFLMHRKRFGDDR